MRSLGRFFRSLAPRRRFRSPGGRAPDPGEQSRSGSEALPRGDAAREAGDWSRAADAYGEHIKAFPDDGPIWLQYGHALKESGRSASAIAAYRRASELVASAAEGRLHLGRALQAAGQEREALAEFGRGFAIAPRFDIYKAAGARLDLEAFRSEIRSDKSIVFDVSDLLSFLTAHGFVTGIQRVQLGVISHANHDRCASHLFGNINFSFSENGQPWTITGDDIAALIAYANQSDVDLARARSLVDRVKDHSTLYAPSPGSVFLTLGAFWNDPHRLQQNKLLKGKDVIIGIMVHDLFPIELPDYCEEGSVQRFESSFLEGMRYWDFVLTNSSFTAESCLNHLRSRGLTTIPVVGVPLAHSFRRAGHDGAGRLPPSYEGRLERPFVLSVGTVEPRKNHISLIDAWSRLHATRPDLPTLLIVGRRGWKSEATMARLEATGLLGDKILWVENISDSELEALYGACLFTVFPSLAEGWGLPIGESLIHGKVCVTSNRTAMPEVGGSCAVYVPPTDLNAMAAAIERLCFDVPYRAELEQYIRDTFTPRTWEDVTRDMISAIERL
jgi:glycosyltransferase involved in cell wall biosynthesis